MRPLNRIRPAPEYVGRRSVIPRRRIPLGLQILGWAIVIWIGYVVYAYLGVL